METMFDQFSRMLLSDVADLTSLRAFFYSKRIFCAKTSWNRHFFCQDVKEETGGRDFVSNQQFDLSTLEILFVAQFWQSWAISLSRALSELFWSLRSKCIQFYYLILLNYIGSCSFASPIVEFCLSQRIHAQSSFSTTKRRFNVCVDPSKADFLVPCVSFVMRIALFSKKSVHKHVVEPTGAPSRKAKTRSKGIFMTCFCILRR